VYTPRCGRRRRMRRRPKATVALLSWILILPTAVNSADLWLQPNPISASPGASVVVSLYEGKPLEGAERTLRADDIGLFQRLWKGGRVNLLAGEETTPRATFASDRPGVQLIAYESASGDRFCKALVVVGTPEPGDPLRWSELGQTLEIVPQSDPTVLAREGGTLEVQVLFDREPLADATVTFVPETDPRAARTLRTDEIGVVRFRLDRPGLWLIRTSHRGFCGGCGANAPEAFGATLTLTAGPVTTRAGS